MSMPRYALLSAALALLGGCDVDGVLVPDRRESLRSGLYAYSTWTETGRPAWWGHVDVRVELDGSIRGSYRLPRQCSNAYGFAVDCIGHVGGRVYPDGRVRFGFDEGWLRHQGEVHPFSEVSGRWDTRLLGASASGEFELLPY
jgi:hypothetical protein